MPNSDTPQADAVRDAKAAQTRVDRLCTAANEAARFAVARYTTFLLVTVYLGIIVGSTTDEDLLRESGVTLPLFGVALPLVPFYAIIPLFYVLLHVHVISQYNILAPILQKLRAALGKIQPAAQPDEQRSLIFPSSFVHMYLNTATTLRMRILLKLSVFVPLLAVPLVLLCWFQLRFLAHHHEGITWLHRVCVLFDLCFIWFYWPKRKDSAEKENHEERAHKEQEASPTGKGKVVISSRLRLAVLSVKRICRSVWLDRRRIDWQRVRFGPTMLIVAFTLVVATVPREAEHPSLSDMDFFWPKRDATGRDDSLLAKIEAGLHRNLVLREMTLVRKKPPPELLAAYKMKDLDLEQAWIEHAEFLNLSQRDLRYADFSHSKLYGVDFRGAKLHGADFWFAKLRGADLSRAKLHGADFWLAELHGANLVKAELYGADLSGAKLRGADLSRAKLHGADLSGAKLHGADLSRAELHGADLADAELHGADLSRAELQGADLRGAELHGAFFYDAELVGCDMRGAEIGGADFTHSNIAQCDLRNVTDEGLNEDNWKQLRKRLSEELEDSPDVLRDVIDKLEEAARRVSNFPHASAQISDCLVSDDSKWAKSKWIAEDSKNFERDLIQYWVKLACDNRWVAKAMVRRVSEYGSFDELPPRRLGLANGLLAAYDQAKDGKKTCDGVRQLDEEMINRLRTFFADPWQNRDSTGD